MALFTSDAQWLLEDAPNPATSASSTSLFFQMSIARWLLVSSGWFFLCLGTAWLLVKTKFKVPFFGFVVYPAAWVVGLLTSAYFFVLWTGNIRTLAIVFWPIISAIYTLLPKIITPQVITSQAKPQLPEPAVRQQFTILFLASAVVSCWFQFQVLAQGWTSQYPVLLLGPLENSTFVTLVGDRPPIAQVAKETVDQTLQLLTIPEVRAWLKNADRFSDAVNDRFQAKLLTAQQRLLTWPNGDGQVVTAQDEVEPRPVEGELIRETWQLRVIADDNNALSLWILLQAQPYDDSPRNQISNRDIYAEYFCTVKEYQPPENVARPIPSPARPLDPTNDAPNSVTTDDDISGFIQNYLDCADEPLIRLF